MGDLPKNVISSKEINPIEAEQRICLVLNFSKSKELSRPISDRRLDVLVRSLDFAILVDSSVLGLTLNRIDNAPAAANKVGTISEGFIAHQILVELQAVCPI
jgi:hypothetical protein